MIYLDHAATTPCRPEVAEAMRPYFTELFGNPSSVHAVGQEARRALDSARDRVAALIGARADEIIFTGSGTEADNMVLIGAYLQQKGRTGHLITAATEHHAVLHTAEWLQGRGVEVTVLPVDSCGRVDPDDVRRALRPETFLVSIMAANNEIGTLAPVREIAAVCREAGVPFHSDAVQWAGALPLGVDDFQADFLVLTAHKFYGPKGTGALYARKGARFQPLLHGGGQERGRRPGTENVAGAVGFARALELAVAEQPETSARITALRQRLVRRVLAEVPDASLNGHPTERLPNNAHFSIPGVESDLLVLNMDLEKIACSSGSACTAGAIEPSHVVKALGVPYERQVSALRLSLGRGTTEAEVDAAAGALVRIAARVRG
ncbi:MAG: cysteine desulfurase family protein [Armatimonadota bacterium]